MIDYERIGEKLARENIKTRGKIRVALSKRLVSIIYIVHKFKLRCINGEMALTRESPGNRGIGNDGKRISYL